MRLPPHAVCALRRIAVFTSRALANRRARAARLPYESHNKELPMLYTIAIVLLILWALGLVSSVTMGGFIHVLLVIAIVVILLRVISGRKVL
jgi:hypothetical protein